MNTVVVGSMGGGVDGSGKFVEVWVVADELQIRWWRCEAWGLVRENEMVVSGCGYEGLRWWSSGCYQRC